MAFTATLRGESSAAHLNQGEAETTSEKAGLFTRPRPSAVLAIKNISPTKLSIAPGQKWVDTGNSSFSIEYRLHSESGRKISMSNAAGIRVVLTFDGSSSYGANDVGPATSHIPPIICGVSPRQ
jgi:hypothetical protein